MHDTRRRCDDDDVCVCEWVREPTQPIRRTRNQPQSNNKSVLPVSTFERASSSSSGMESGSMMSLVFTLLYMINVWGACFQIARACRYLRRHSIAILVAVGATVFSIFVALIIQLIDERSDGTRISICKCLLRHTDHRSCAQCNHLAATLIWEISWQYCV